MFRNIAFVTIITLSSTAIAAEDAVDPATLETFRPYMLDTCLVSGEKIGSMGEGLSIVHQGQEITFCCKGCIKPFAKKPAHFIAKMKAVEKAVEGASEKAGNNKPGEAALHKGHAGH